MVQESETLKTISYFTVLVFNCTTLSKFSIIVTFKLNCFPPMLKEGPKAPVG